MRCFSAYGKRFRTCKQNVSSSPYVSACLLCVSPMNAFSSAIPSRRSCWLRRARHRSLLRPFAGLRIAAESVVATVTSNSHIKSINYSFKLRTEKNEPNRFDYNSRSVRVQLKHLGLLKWIVPSDTESTCLPDQMELGHSLLLVRPNNS